MRNLAKYALFGTLILMFAIPIQAETDLSITGQVRVRGELERKSFDTTLSHFQDFSIMRTRINIKAKVDKNAVAFIQLQDSRTLGGYNQFGDMQAVALNDSKNVDVHQAFIKATIWENSNRKVGFLAGRFEFNWGNERLLGGVGWSNVGRSWEGGLIWYKTNKYDFSAGKLKVMEINDPGYNRDYDFHYATLKLKEFNLDLLSIYEVNSDTTGYDPDIKALERFTFAAYYEREHNQFDFEMNTAYQFGQRPRTLTTEYDISAFLFTFEAGYSFDNDYNTRFAVGIDYMSGDDDLTDGDWKTFDDLYPTGHKFSGYMDYFLGGGPNGLVDIMARGEFDVTDGWTVKGDFHIFRAAEEYPSALGLAFGDAKNIGTEIDLTVTTNRIKGLKMQWGASMFIAKDDFAGLEDDGKQSGFWFYEQVMINF